jgi:hypothetical protein
MAEGSYKAAFLVMPERKLIVEYHQGIIIIDTLIEYKKRQAAHPDFSPNYDILVDLTKTIFSRKPKNIERYINYLFEHEEVAGVRKVALFVDGPDSVVIATLYQQMHGKLNQVPQIFSTLEIALDWLRSDMTVEDVSGILDSLRLSPE